MMRAAGPGGSWEYIYPAWVIPLGARITGIAKGYDIATEVAESFIMLAPDNLILVAMARTGLALMAVQNSDPVAAAKQYESLKPLSGVMLRHVPANVNRLVGLLAQTMGNLDTSAGHFEDALSFCRKAGYRPELAWSLCDYADMLLERASTGSSQAHAGDRDKAMSHFDESLAISTELGMKPLMERVLSRRDILKA